MAKVWKLDEKYIFIWKLDCIRHTCKSLKLSKISSKSSEPKGQKVCSTHYKEQYNNATI